jgi:hypothetical protein
MKTDKASGSRHQVMSAACLFCLSQASAQRNFS